MKGYELKVSALAAALKCAGNDDVRYYLNGVYLEFPKGRIVATDGHRLFCGSIPAIDCPPIIVPRATVEAALKANRSLKKRERESCALFVNVSEAWTPAAENAPPSKILEVTLNHALAGQSFSAPAVNGKFPDYERVIPDKVTGAASAYNCRYLAEAAEALSLYAENYGPVAGQFMNWAMNGPTDDASKNDGPGIFTLTEVSAFVVIMPVRTVTSAEKGTASMDWYNLPAKPNPASTGEELDPAS